MRLLLSLAALAAVTFANDWERVERVLKTWDPSKPLQVVDRRNTSQYSIPYENDFIIAATSPCLPGYTGDSCTNPICTSENKNVPNKPAVGGDYALLDAAVLSNCQQNYALLIDDTLSNIRIRVSADLNVNPQFTLQDSNGKNVTADDEWDPHTPQQYELIYFTLTAGVYTVIPRADVPISCYLQAQAHTKLTVVGGFIAGDRTTVERNDRPLDYVYTGTTAAVVVHPNEQMSPGVLKTIKFAGTQNTYYPPDELRVRYGCGYEYLTWGFSCAVTGQHFFQVEGITHYGNGYRRIVSFDCLQDFTNATMPPTTVAPSPKTCHNGGFKITNLDGSSYCYCTGLWTGSDCSQILCLNGGTVNNDDNTCKCLDAYNGFHCENVFCMDDGGFGFNANSPTLIFVIRGRQQMNNVIDQVSQAAGAFISTMQFDPTYFTSFILVLFNNNQMIHSQRYNQIDDLQRSLAAFQQNFTSDGGCTDSVFTGISQALNMYPSNKSPMYVFTDVPPSDTAQSETIINQLSFWRVPINIVYTPATLCTVAPDDPNYWAMDNLAKKSMGATFYLSNQNGVFNFTYDHLSSTAYRSQLMLSMDFTALSGANPYQPVALENNVQELTIVGTGTNLALSLSPPETTINPITDNLVYYSDGRNFIWNFRRTNTGIWLINLNSTDPSAPASFKVYQKSHHGVSNQQTQYDMFWAFTGAVDSDGPSPQPIYGLSLGMSIHLTNYPDYIPPQYIQAGLNIYALRNGKQVELYASDGIWRDGCTYNFYFPPFACPVADETLYFNFYARDEMGLPIQRSGVMNCMLYEATHKPPSDCQNGGVWNPSNSSCFCPLGYSGTRCERITCFNGGTPINNAASCQCTTAWTGPNCQIAKCMERGPDPEVLMVGVDMVFAVELTQNGQAQLAYLNKNFAELIRDVQSSSRTWIRNFVIVGYNSTWGDVVAFAPSFNPEAIIHAMDVLANTLYTDTGCTVQLYRALNRAVMRGTTPPGSFIEIFTATPADESANGGWSQLYESMRELYLTVYGFLNIRNPYAGNPTGLACNATYQNYQLLFDLTGGSSGKVYPSQASMVQDLMKVIPMQYMSGMVYGQVGYDCTAPMQVYFPIDAYTQTILLSVVGNNTQVQMYDGNNNPVEVFHFMHDTVSLWDLYEIRKPCDNGWVEVGQYCTYFSQAAKTWADAHDFCSQAGGFVVDDLTSDKHRFLGANANSRSFWMGLTNMDGSGYVWDRGYNYTTALNQSETYWTGGNTPTFDASKQCVFWDATSTTQNTWTPDACSTQRTFVCQKHRYDADSPPTDINSNRLNPGMWYVNITSSSPPGISSYDGCYAEIRVQSKIYIYTGFVTNQIMDYPAPDPVNNSPNNMLITYVHAEDHSSNYPIMKYATMWDAYNGTFYNAATYQPRFGCSFGWLSQPFSCPNGNSEMNEFVIGHVGEDEFGNMFQRVTLAHCSPPVLTCGNGGYRYNGKCICNEYWTGAYCTTPICVNGATLDPKNDQQCLCQSGYGGPNCQFDECRPQVHADFSIDNRTLILILEATNQTYDVFTQLSNNFANIVNNALSLDAAWFKNYVLVTFNSDGIRFQHYVYTDPSAVQLGIKLQQAGITDKGSCQLPIYTVLKQVLMQQDQISMPNSQILMITAATASDYMTRTETIEQLSYSEANLHWLYMQTDTCGSIPNDDSVPHLVKLAYASNGNVAFLKSGSLTSFLTPYLASRYTAQVLDNPTVDGIDGAAPLTCPSGKWYVQVDGNTTSLYVTSNSLVGTISITNPSNAADIPQKLFSGDGMTQFYQIDTRGMPGTYTIQLSSPGMCFLSVWGVGSMGVFTHFAGTDSKDPIGAHKDGSEKAPYANASSTAVFHLAGSPGHRGQLQYLEVYDVVAGQTILRSELYRRSSCSYEYYSDPFTCAADIITLYIYGHDENYQQFRRQQMSFCLNSTLPTAPPITSTSMMPPITQAATTTTSSPLSSATPPASTSTTPSPTTSFGNPNLIFDVVFVVDMSKSAANTFDDMSAFITNLMSSYTVSQDMVRVALIPVQGAASPQTIPLAFFNTITSQANLNYYMGQMKQWGQDFTDDGQSLQHALDQATNNNFFSQGYRSSQPNHLLVYVTSTSTLTDNPSTASILSKNQYGVIVVGYGSGVTNGAALQALSGGAGCYFSAANAADLNSKIIPDVQAAIWQANSNKGSYCGNGPAN